MSARAREALFRTFRVGTKKVFLPQHIVCFLAPRPNQPPTFARFKVPLRFNKFDMRDYLLHVYRTPVLGVRSHIRQQPIRRSKIRARIFRPKPIKTMIVELTKPFVWPSLPTNQQAWLTPSAAKVRLSTKRNHAERVKLQKTGFMPLRDQKATPEANKLMRQEAKRLLKQGGWSNQRELDPKFTEKKEKKTTMKGGEKKHAKKNS
ncbi:hypothetical protein GGR50DRAFT_114977 [Xylaria sp. CBS 124048]|nr:hypothetical protein GGR50DRAFT_114977 [Xylaria sp. CBS 124048]